MKFAIIVDLDGTVADCSERLKYIVDENGKKLPGKQRDYKKFFQGSENDPAIEHIVQLVNHFHNLGVFIVFVTGRPVKEMMAGTKVWISKTFPTITNHILYMRKFGDYRADGEAKLELVEDFKQDFQEYTILFALDDRPSVIEPYNKAGVNCIDVTKYKD